MTTSQASSSTDISRLIIALCLSSAVSFGLLMIRILASDSMRYVFLPWNLVLAVVPLVLSWWLVERVRSGGWLTWQQTLLTVVWLSFLPNSFYLISDFVHLRETYEINLVFDIVMLMSFAVNGLIFGFMSLYMVHRELNRRIQPKQAYILISLVILACSFAAYLGRYTRWNSWDIVLRPAGLLFDVSDRFINPSAHQQTYLTTLIFFALLMSLYIVMWETARLLRHK